MPYSSVLAGEVALVVTGIDKFPRGEFTTLPLSLTVTSNPLGHRVVVNSSIEILAYGNEGKPSESGSPVPIIIGVGAAIASIAAIGGGVAILLRSRGQKRLISRHSSTLSTTRGASELKGRGDFTMDMTRTVTMTVTRSVLLSIPGFMKLNNEDFVAFND